jgi:hypothetical protein
MANPIIKIKRGATAPVATLNAGEFAIDQAAKNLYLGVEVGGVTTNEIVGGEGTFATKTYVGNAITTATGNLGTMSTQNADSVAITGGTMDGVSISMGTVFGTNLQTVAIGSSSYIADSTIENTPIGATTPSTGAFTTLTASSAPSASNDVVRKTDLDTAISALGSVFHYVGDVSSATTPLDLTTLSDTTTGAYYKVDADGAYTDGATTFNAKVGDAFVKTSTGWQKLDNVDAVVSGTANEIAVTGDENAGYTVAIDSAFSGRVNNLEIKTEYQSQGNYNGKTYTKISSDEVIGGDFWVTTGGTDPDSGNAVFAVANNSAQVLVNSAGHPSGGLFVSGVLSVEDAGGLADIIINADSNGIVLGGQYAGAPPSTLNIYCRHNLLGVNDPHNSTMMNIKNFVIDGGTF